MTRPHHHIASTLVLGLLSLALSTVESPAITIGQGPIIGTDKRGTIWYQEFQDWSTSDLRALDQPNDQFKFNIVQDTGRDLVALYSHDDGTNLYFRLDLHELGFNWQNDEVDIYVAIDCAPGGESWLPDYCDAKTDRPWEAMVGIYNSSAGVLYATNWTSYPLSFLGSYWRADLDAVEFGIRRDFLTDRGWNGSASSLQMQAFSTRDGTNAGQNGEIDGQASDIVDAIGALVVRGNTTSNGWLLGSVPASATASRAKYAVIAHANQSVSSRTGTQKHIYQTNALYHAGFVRLLDSAEMFNLPINLHISGTLMMSFLWAVQNPADTQYQYPDRDGPTFMKRCKDFVTAGPGSLIGGVLAEHIMPYFEGEVNRKSIEQNSELIQHYFGLSESDMKVMHVPERVIRSQTNHPRVSASGPLDGKTFEEIEQSGFAATYLDEVTHLHWWFYPNETTNSSWDNNNCGRWAGGLGNDEEPYHHKIHKINGVYTFMINDREDQSKFGNYDSGMELDTRTTLLQKALHPDSAQITIVFDDWEALAGNSFASPDPNNNADQFHNTLRWAANKQWIEFKNLKDVVTWAQSDTNWVINHGYVYDKSSETYEWLKRASEQTYDHWYYGSALEENFFNRTAAVHNTWSPAGMKKYGDMNTPGTLIRDSWDAIQQITSPYLKKISEWSYSAMIYETAWHDEDANPDQYKSRNYQVDFNRGTAQGNCDESLADNTYDKTSGWAVRLHGHVRDMGVMKAASDWITNIKSGTQTATTTVYAADIDDDTLHEYVLCNDKVFICIERWGARVIKAFAYDPFMNGGDARMVIGVPVANPPEESENEGANNNRNSVFKDHWSTGQNSNGYIDQDYASLAAPVSGIDYWEFISADGRIRKRITLPAGRDLVVARYSISDAVGTLYVRNGLGPNQMDLMFNGTSNLVRKSDSSFRGLQNLQGGEAYLVRGRNTTLGTGAIADSGWDNRELAMTELFEAFNTSSATNFSMAVAFSEASALDADRDGIANTNELAGATDPFNPDSDGDGLPDGWESSQGLDAIAPDADADTDGDGMSNWEEYIAGTAASGSNSFFAVAASTPASSAHKIQYLAQSGRLYQVYLADEQAQNGWNWRSFGNTNIPFGSYFHNAPAGVHTFTDDFTAATSGGAPTNNARLYYIRVSKPE